MNDWLHLTDRYNSPMLVLREDIRGVYGDTIIIPKWTDGAPEGQQSCFGTTIVFKNDSTTFCAETVEDVIAMMEVPA